MQKFSHTISDIVSLENLNAGTLTQEDGSSPWLGLEVGEGRRELQPKALFSKHLAFLETMNLDLIKANPALWAIIS